MPVGELGVDAAELASLKPPPVVDGALRCGRMDFAEDARCLELVDLGVRQPGELAEHVCVVDADVAR